MNQWTDNELNEQIAAWVKVVKEGLGLLEPVGSLFNRARQAVDSDVAANGELNKDIDRLHKVIEAAIGHGDPCSP